MQKSIGKVVRAVFVLTACLTISNYILAQEKQIAPAATPETQSVEKQPTAILAAKMMQDNTRRYRIGVNDELDIQVFRHPEYSQTVRVNEYGLVMLPRIDEPIEAICLTENELAAQIVKLYSNYLRQPYVRVYVKEFKSQPVAVIGAVDKPGQFNLNRKMRLIEAVAVAGGPTDKASTLR